MTSGFPVLVFTLLLSTSTLAIASSSGTALRVDGAIAPGAACEMAVGTGIIDFGHLSLNDLNPDPSKPTALEAKRVPMHIDCASPRRYVLASSGSTPATGVDHDFGLYSQSDNALVGSLYVRFDSWSVHIEGVDGFYTWTYDASDLATAVWADSTGDVMPVPTGTSAIGFVTRLGSYEAPSPIGHFDTYLLVDPRVRPVNELDLADELTFSGHLGLEIKYF